MTANVKKFVGRAPADKPLMVDISTVDALTTITVDENENVPSVRIYSERPPSPLAAHVIEKSQITQRDGLLSIDVPPLPYQNTVSQQVVANGNVVIGNVSFGGQMATGTILNNTIRVDVTVPTGASVTFRTGNGSLRTVGALAVVKAKSKNGDISLDSVSAGVVRTKNGDVSVSKAWHIDVETVNGEVAVREVIELVTLVTVNGGVSVISYRGRNALIKTINGKVVMNILPGSSGEVGITTMNGSIAVRGHKNADSLNTSTKNGIVKLD